MDAETILRIKPTLTRFLHEFEPCMGRITNRRHLETYVAGQLSDLQRKSVEPIADAAGQAPRTLQEFLGLLRWDEAAVREVKRSWRLVPGTENGKPVKMWGQFAVTFKLTD